MRPLSRSARGELARARAEAGQASSELEAGRRQVRLLRAALDLVPQGVVVVGADGRELLRNEAAEGLVDARHGDALAAHLLGTVVEEAVRTGGRTRTLELQGPPRRVLEIQAMPVSAAGDPEATVALIQDVTERHHLDAMRRDFVANVSHELRTPVGALGALAEALCQEDDPAVMRRLGARINAEAERAAGLINDLLDLSRVEGAAGTRPEPLVAGRLVAEAVARIRAGADERAIRIVQRGIDGSVRLTADAGQLVSALANLLDNAVKYSDPGSTVEVEVLSDPRRVSFRVTDRGIGIPARDHERIFERFYRVDRARSRETGGTGLGLAIVRHVALNHGGRVTVDSREGEGSTFTLILPREVA
ncbi:MAG TPA: ATP-binding protein [Acidimicrobiales bacterium]|nr:ATP-binding protein [Acidimicrobiales bacterium]